MGPSKVSEKSQSFWAPWFLGGWTHPTGVARHLNRSQAYQVWLKNNQPAMIFKQKKKHRVWKKLKLLAENTWGEIRWPQVSLPVTLSCFFPVFFGISAEEMVAMTRPAVNTLETSSYIVLLNGGFHKWGYPHSWIISWMVYFMENPVKRDDLGVPLF